MIISRQEAKAQKLKFYFTGNPCKYGHICERYVKSCMCIECNKIAFKNFVAENPDYNKGKYKQQSLARYKHRYRYDDAFREKRKKEAMARYYAKKALQKEGLAYN